MEPRDLEKAAIRYEAVLDELRAQRDDLLYWRTVLRDLLEKTDHDIEELVKDITELQNYVVELCSQARTTRYRSAYKKSNK